VNTVDTLAADRALQAAEAALPLLPVGDGATSGTATAGDIPADWPVVLLRFTGTPSGWCALALEPGTVTALVAALAAARGQQPGDGDVAAACDPALRAAVAAVGPTAPSEPEATTLSGLATATADGDMTTVRIAVDGEPAAYLVLVVEGAPTGVPGPRTSQDAATPASPTAGATASGHGLDLLRSVPMEVTAEIGRTRMTIQELLGLTPGAVVELDRPVGSPADVLVNGRLFARGEVVVVDEDFAIRITEIIDTSETPGS
jgi:flagellar motor switch protein FliN/FliY